MKLLVVAHGTTPELARVGEFINRSGVQRSTYFLRSEPGKLIDLDTIREHLEMVDALFIAQCQRSGNESKFEYETELQRVERLAVTEAYEIGRVVAISGTIHTLQSGHLDKSLRTGHASVLIVTHDSPRDITGGISDCFENTKLMVTDDIETDAAKIIQVMEECLPAPKRVA